MARRKTPESETDVPASDGPAMGHPGSGAEPVPVQVSDSSAETVPDNSPEAAADTLRDPAPVPQVSAPSPRRAGVLGPLFGGALAALGGFGLAQFNVLGLAPSDQGQAIAALDQKLTAGLSEVGPSAAAVAQVRDDLAALGQRVAALETAPAQAAPDLSRLDRLMDELDARLAAIEALPAGNGEASTAALAIKLAEVERRLAAQPAAVDQGQVDAALARLAAAEAEAVKRSAEAAATADAAAQSAALDRLLQVVDTGGPFEAALAATTDPALNQALAPYAEGVATMADLQAAFPDPARLALTLARESTGGQGWGARFMDFLASQTGARSLQPREGTEPDAILSRVEFALGEGRLADALNELGTMDPALQAPFQGWTASASARLAVDQALAAAQEAR